MSLPTAKKEISDKPAPNAVTDPVIKADKDADVDRKIRLYGVIEAFRQGRMPDNNQIDETLKYIQEHSLVDVDALSGDGRKLILDTRDIIETARLMVTEKNADELFQNFIWHTRDVDFDQAKKDPKEVLPVDKEKAQQDGQRAVQHLRTILRLVLTNSEVRKLLSDFSVMGRDLLARGAVKAAEKLRPDEERLAHVNDPAPQDQFITKDAKPSGADDGTTPISNGATTKTVNSDEVKDDLTAEKGAKVGAEGQTDANGSHEAGGSESEAKKQGFRDKMRGYRDNIVERIPQQHKEKANDKLERGKQFLAEEYFPEERRDQFIFRGKKVIIECQKHDDYQESIRWLLTYIEEYVTHARTVGEKGKDSHNKLKSDPALKTALSEFRTLLERFANGTSMDVIFDAMNVLIDDSRKDQELRDWFKQVGTYIRKVLLDAGFVIEPECNNQGNALRESGRKFYDEKYKTHFDKLFNSIGSWFRAMGEDPLNKRFGEDWARLTRDLLFDSEGSLKFKPELWNDLRKVVVPALVDKVGYIPIPRIEYTDDNLDLVVENLTLSGRNLFPNVVSFEAHNYVKFSPYQAITDEHHHELTLTLGQMQADMRDVAFYFRKKTGIPKLMDSGLADVLLGGEGLTASAHIVSADKDKSSVFKVKKVSVKVDSLKFSIRDSKHDALYKILGPLATGLVKKQIQKAIADAIETGLEYVDGQLVSVRDRMREAKATDGQSRTQVLQDMFKRKKDEPSVKGSEKGSQFKVVANKKNSVLANQGHPAGWVNRTAEKEEAAARGEGWKSEVFSIV